MKCAVLFSGGKDSVYSAYLAKQRGYDLSCLISIFSKNKESYMFHTPSISQVERQAKAMNIPIIIQKTQGDKEEELKDLEKAIKRAIKKYKINCVITGAIKSVYQSSRIQKICDRLKIKCFNPLWQIDEVKYLDDLIRNKFKVMIVGIAAEGFSESWISRIIDKKMISELKELNKKYKIHLAFEGGEAETFVLSCPLFKKELVIIKSKKVMERPNTGYLDIQEIK